VSIDSPLQRHHHDAPPNLSTRSANAVLIRSSASVSHEYITRSSSIDENVEIVIAKRVSLDDISSCNRRDSYSFARKGRCQTRVIDHNDAGGRVLRILSLPPFDEIVLDASPNGTVNTDGRSAGSSTPIRKSVSDTIATKTHIFDSRVQESSEASVTDLIVFDLRPVRLDAKPDEVVRDLVPDHLHFREIVHAQTDDSESRLRGTNLVLRHFGVDGAGGQEAVLGGVEELVVADLGVFGANDQDVQTGKPTDGQAGDFDASDWSLDRFDAHMLDDEVFEVKSCSGDTYSSLAGRLVVVWAGEVCAFVACW